MSNRITINATSATVADAVGKILDAGYHANANSLNNMRHDDDGNIIAVVSSEYLPGRSTEDEWFHGRNREYRSMVVTLTA